MAVSALAGCVTVPPPSSAPRPPTAPSGSAVPPAPGPDGVVRTPAVQAPAREALEMIGPSDAERPSAAPPRPTGPPPTVPERPVPSPDRDRPSRPDRPAPGGEAAAPGPAVGGPGSGPARGRGADVCALGRTYGHWPQDSPQAAICREVYGR